LGWDETESLDTVAYYRPIFQAKRIYEKEIQQFYINIESQDTEIIELTTFKQWKMKRCEANIKIYT
jgi:hypothetical protein